MNRSTLCVALVLLLAANFSVRTSYSLTVRGMDYSARQAETYVELPSGSARVNYGESRTFKVPSDSPITVVRRAEIGWSHIPTKPSRRYHISLRDGAGVRSEPMLFVLAMFRSRKVILNYPPVSSVWHLPAGVAQLAAVLRSDGHEVVQRYGHILGLEYVLKERGGADVGRALAAVRNPQSDINALYDARTTFERVSRHSIATRDKFEVARNNVSYVSCYYDGSVERAWDAVRHRERHLWYNYFTKVELPIARDFKPDLYGISVADERQFIQGLILASLVKDEFPGCLVVLGGNFWTRVIPVHNREFSRFFGPCCDAIVYKEGFRPIREIARTLKPWTASGTVWMDPLRGRVANPPTEEAVSFETLTTPVFDGGARQWAPDFVPSLYTMSNCPMACGFCAIAAGSDTYLAKPRSMTPRRIAEHMANLGATRFEIFDETFPISRQLALGKELKRIGLQATWNCYLTVTDNLVKPETCEKLYEAGCRSVQLGLETLSPDTLLRERKRWNTPKNYGAILANLKTAGIQTHVFLLVGLPGEPLHLGLKWLPFLEQYGDSILTIKSGRYRLTRHSPEERGEIHNQLIEVMPNTKPLHLNRDFRYRDISRKKVEAMRDILEQACRSHWAYAVTSTIPWWVNRGRYSWEELRQMAALLPPEQPVAHLARAIARINSVLQDELGTNTKVRTFEELVALSRTI